MKIVCLVFVFFAMESDYRGCSAMLYTSVITRLFHALTLLKYFCNTFFCVPLSLCLC